ncbi:MAG: hypothetical protein ACOYLM_01855 [Methylococcaceae bacterium]|jgi:hypothetical protein
MMRMLMRRRTQLGAGLLWLALGSLGFAQAGSEADADIQQEWQPTTLSDKTLAKIHGGVEAYQKCLNDETRLHGNDPLDSRKVTDLILGRCDKTLTVVKQAFDGEKVPSVISDRYIKSKRSRAAQQVVKVVMGAQAARYAKDHP